MVGGYILLNGEVLTQIQSDDYDNPTEISKDDFYKIFDAIKSGKEIKVGMGSVVYPVLATTAEEDDGTLTFAITDGELNVSIITFSVFYTMDDTDPDNVVYTYFGIFKQSAVGGGGGLYQHYITIKTGTTASNRKQFRFTIINDRAEAFDDATLATYMNERAVNNMFHPASMDIITESGSSGSPAVYFKRFNIVNHIKTAATIGSTAASYTSLEFVSETSWGSSAITATVKILDSQLEYFSGSSVFYSFNDEVYNLS